MIRGINTIITPAVLLSCIKEHQQGLPRLNRLYRYYKGEQDILKKTKDNPLAPNNKLASASPYYITTIANGFTFATPLTYKGGQIDNLTNENKLAKVASHDSELGEDLSIFGRAYELVYMSKLPLQHVKLNNLSPMQSFVVYSNEIDPEPLFGVYYYEKTDSIGKATGYELNVYDTQKLYIYSMRDLSSLPSLLDEFPHFAGQVPIIEYKNNDEAIGDYERVLTLIDAYDRLQSDRIDDKDQFIDAIMVAYGTALIDSMEDAPEFSYILKTFKILQDLPENARIEYLKKALDETSVEVLRAALKSDISKFSLVPELTDESFASNTSGVAMEYKTLGLKWLSNIKRRMFKKSLDRRLQIMNSYMQKLGRGFDSSDIDIVFGDTLPLDIMSYLPYAQNNLSKKTMVGFLADKFGITDVDAELAQLAAEQEETNKRNAALFNGNTPFGVGDEE